MSIEDEAPLPGPSKSRSLLDAFRETYGYQADARSTAPVRITITGDPQSVETMLPGIREAFYPKDPIIIGESKFNTVGYDLNRPVAHGLEPGPWTLTVELIEALR